MPCEVAWRALCTVEPFPSSLPTPGNAPCEPCWPHATGIGMGGHCCKPPGFQGVTV